MEVKVKREKNLKRAIDMAMKMALNEMPLVDRRFLEAIAPAMRVCLEGGGEDNTFIKAIAPADEAFCEARDQIEKAYIEAITPALEACVKVVA